LDIYKCPFLHDPPDFFLGIFFGYDRTFSPIWILFYTTRM